MNLKELADRQLTMLQPTDNENTFEVKLKFTGYDDLLFTISNLIQLSINQVRLGEDDLPEDMMNPYVDTGRILELALQLIPHDEAKLLDACMKIKQSGKPDDHSTK